MKRFGQGAWALLYAVLGLVSDSVASAATPDQALLRLDRVGCLGFLATPRADTPDSAPAYAFSAGHCWDHRRDVSVLDEEVEVQLSAAGKDSKKRRVPRVRKLAYGSFSEARMDDPRAPVRDLILMEMTQTVGELKKAGFAFFHFATRAYSQLRVYAPDLHQASVQFGGYRNPAHPVFVRLDYRWDADGPQPTIGSSGTPLFAVADPSSVLGIGVLLQAGTPEKPGWSFVATRIEDLAPCFDEAGRFELQRVGCPLEKPLTDN